jgi:hypothetical protein
MDEKLRQALDEQRHQETLGALTELSSVLKSLHGKKDDSAIQEVLQKNAELINKFGNKLDDFSKPDAPEVKVSVNQEMVVSEIKGLKGSIDSLIPLMQKMIELEEQEKNVSWEFMFNRNGYGVTTSVSAKKLSK